MKTRRARLTLIESLIVLLSMAIIVAITLQISSRLIENSKLTSCQFQLRQVVYAIQNYMETYSIAPYNLDEAMEEFIVNEESFYCPNSEDHYDSFYIANNHLSKSGYLIGCPNHGSKQILFSSELFESKILPSNKIVVDGIESFTGLEVEANEVKFSDGSRLEIDNGSVMVLASYEDEGRQHHVIRLLDKNIPQLIKADIVDGSTITVKSPTSVTELQDSSFDIQTQASEEDETIITAINIHKGLGVIELPNKEEEKLFAGDQIALVADLAMAQMPPGEHRILNNDGVIEREQDKEKKQKIKKLKRRKSKFKDNQWFDFIRKKVKKKRDKKKKKKKKNDDDDD